mmetsp:Transcript_30832/g.47233  ORF Transcript_30832/g.47233 Transcript_30832/m.47233 type:complete len:96 (-) Transcript_30832:625-912(-)
MPSDIRPIPDSLRGSSAEERKEEAKSNFSRQISKSIEPSSNDSNDYQALAVRLETPILSRLDLPTPEQVALSGRKATLHANPGRSCSDTKLPPIS